MIRLDFEKVNKLTSAVFYKTPIQEFLDLVEDIIVNPISFSPFNKEFDTIQSKSYPVNTIIPQLESEAMREHENYVFSRMSTLGKDQTIITQGGPGIPYGNILCWDMLGSKSYGLINIANTKMLLADIDEELVLFISHCTAQVYVNEHVRTDPLSRDELFERLLTHQIDSQLQLASALQESSIQIKQTYRMICMQFPEERLGQVVPYVKGKFQEIYSYCGCVWLNNVFAVLVDGELYNITHKNNENTERLRSLCRYLHCPLCISLPINDLMDCELHYKRILSLPEFRHQLVEDVIFYEDYPECNLIYASGLASQELKKLCEDVVLQLIEHDSQHQSNYLETLEQYILAGSNAAQAAKALYIHPNTVLYRINKMQEDYHFDISDTKTLFSLMLSLRIIKYC